MRVKGVLAVIFSVLLVQGAYAADTYRIDPTHANFGFSVQHLMVSKTTGSFDQFDGTILFDPNDLAASSIDITIQAASIDTNVQQRDEHLRSSDFFAVEEHPTLTFKSKSIAKEGEAYTITGDLTIRGVTKEIAVPASIVGPVQSPFGKTVIGISAQFKVNRQDYGVSWNKALDAGGYVVSDEVEVNVSIEAHKE